MVLVVVVVAQLAKPPQQPRFAPSPPGSVHTVLETRGALLVDGSGSALYLNGVDWPSLDWAPAGQHADGAPGLALGELARMFQRFHANAVRIALNEAFWLRGSPRYAPGYAALVERAVRAARRDGLVVILDLHTAIGADSVSAAPASGPSCAPDPPSLVFWREVASRFRNWPGVAFELYNEPHDLSWQLWRNGGALHCPTTGRRVVAVGEQELLEAIRQTGARNLVIADGLDWAGSLAGVYRWHLDGSNVAYGLHLYVAESDPTGPRAWSRDLGSVWRRWPVVATEFGVLGCRAPYPDVLERRIVAFLIQHGIGWTAWGWWAGGCGFPSLITNESGRPFEGGVVVAATSAALAAGMLRPIEP